MTPQPPEQEWIISDKDYHIALEYFHLVARPLSDELKKERERVLGVRPSVMRFAMAMELVLRKNDHKGGWSDIGYYKLLERAYDELEECRREMRESKSGGMRRASREMVDVANFCMMFFDNLYSMQINSEYLERKLESLRGEP